MKWIPSFFVMTFFGLISLRAVEVVPKVCWFDPPTGLEQGRERSDPGDNLFRMQSYAVIYTPAERKPNEYRELRISMRKVGATIGDGKKVTITPVSEEQLKARMLGELNSEQASNKPVVEETRLAGQKAFKLHLEIPLKTNLGPPARYQHDFFWVRVRPNDVLEVHLIGEGDAALKDVQSWLATLKINVSEQPEPDPRVSFGKDAARLGANAAQVHERCGDPSKGMGSGPVDSYFTPQLFIIVIYSGRDGLVDTISYSGVSDPQKMYGAMLHSNNAIAVATKTPITPEAAAKLLLEHTEDAKLDWKLISPDLWQRSDGAMATRNNGSLFIVTLQSWMNIHFGSSAAPNVAPATMATSFGEMQLIEQAKKKLQTGENVPAGSLVTWEKLAPFVDPPLKPEALPQDVWGKPITLGTIGSPPKLSKASVELLQKELTAVQLKLWERFIP